MCLMKLWYKNGSIIWRTGVRYQKSRRKYLPGTCWTELGSERDDDNVYIREQVKINSPKYVIVLK